MIDTEAALQAIRDRAFLQELRISQHAQQEMAEEAIRLEDVLDAIANGRIIENYPDHRRGSCCLLHGNDRAGRDIHVVCTTTQAVLIIITVYLPLPPKWISPTQRRSSP